MNNYIEKISEIKNEDFDFISEYFTNKNFIEFPTVDNILIYKNESYILKKPEYKKEIKDLQILKKDINLIEKFENCINYLKTLYNIKVIWFMTYPPKGYLGFHVDINSNRHIIPLNENEKFFSYQTKQDHDKFTIYSKKLKDSLDSPEIFNDYFLNEDKENKILILNKNSVYTFGSCAHSILNASNVHRFNFVFELI